MNKKPILRLKRKVEIDPKENATKMREKAKKAPFRYARNKLV